MIDRPRSADAQQNTGLCLPRRSVFGMGKRGKGCSRPDCLQRVIDQ